MYKYILALTSLLLLKSYLTFDEEEFFQFNEFTELVKRKFINGEEVSDLELELVYRDLLDYEPFTEED